MVPNYYKYLGVPYKFNGTSIKEGLDCINLCIALAKDNNVPMMNINHADNDMTNYHGLFELRNNLSLFKKVEPQPNVLVVFKIAGVIGHVGYMLTSKDFIHIMEGSKVTVETITEDNWNRRLIGFYKYIGD